MMFFPFVSFFLVADTLNIAVSVGQSAGPKYRVIVEMCAIYMYGNDDVLRMNAFSSLSFLFDAFCFHLI